MNGDDLIYPEIPRG